MADGAYFVLRLRPVVVGRASLYLGKTGTEVKDVLEVDERVLTTDVRQARRFSARDEAQAEAERLRARGLDMEPEECSNNGAVP